MKRQTIRYFAFLGHLHAVIKFTFLCDVFDARALDSTKTNFLYFREAVYAWNPAEDHEECENETLIEGQMFKPKGKIGSLQALFALMEFSQRK